MPPDGAAEIDLPETDVMALTAVAAQRAIAERRVTSVELVSASLNRVAEVNPFVNAMVTVAAERALTQAEQADAKAAAGEPLGPLHGLPVAIKDLQATEGILTTFGSAEFADNVPAADAGIVAKIRAAGAIIVGKTNIPERSIGANTVNRLFGATGNPFDPAKTCGGSSGGSGVVLATNMVPLATGSDHGGSLRIPACYCGVVGYRATPGVIPFEERTTAQTYYSVQGPMARTVDDVALLTSVIARRAEHGPRDPMAFPLDTDRFATLDMVDLAEVRVGFTEDLGGVLVSEEIRQAFRSRVEAIAALVGTCEPVTVDLGPAAEADWRLRSDVFVTQYHAEADRWDPNFNPNIRSSYDAALATPMEDIARARGVQMELIRRFQAVTDRYDVIICPGVSVSPFPWNELNPTEVDGVPVENYMAWLTLTAAITVIGHPVVALPAGLDGQAMPFGLQLVGRTYDDRRLLSVAKALEAAFALDPAMARPEPDIEALLSSTVDLQETAGTV